MPLARRVAAIVAALLVAAAAQASARTLRVGTVTLHACPAHAPGWCGSIRRALDPGLAGGPRIPIAMHWYPAASRHPRGTIVAVEGGPGYPSTGSFYEYHGTFGPLQRQWNMLLVDNRGTGGSALVKCRGLDRFPLTARASGPRFDTLVGACGRQLNRRYETSGGHPVHASDLFGTAYAVDDLRAVLRRLGLRRIDLYGDSYGSWFTQAFMARYPGVLRSVILDSTYAIRGLDPVYASSGSSGRAALDRVCARDPGCAAAGRGRGTPVTRLATLLTRLRRAPILGTVRQPDGTGRRIEVTPRRLADLFQNGGSEPLVLRDFDASVRAALAGDDTPLLRLVALAAGNGGYPDPGYFSDGLYMAVGCTDYPQLFSMDAAPAERRRQLAAAAVRAPAAAFAPFTTAEWLTISAYSETYDACLDWPRPVHHAPVVPTPDRALPASVPLLVIGGDLDDLTPLADAARFAPGLGRTVRIVDLHNAVHVTSEGDTNLSVAAACARSIIRRFVAAPNRLRHLDTACAARTPHVHTPGAYPLTLGRAVPATVVSGRDPGLPARRAATVAAGAFADATDVALSTGDARGPGLRGGRFTLAHGRFSLDQDRFAADATVSGAGTYRAADGAVRCQLTVTSGRLHVDVALRWSQRSRFATARLAGARLRLPAP
jgi:pimeloyl-ACP methyl ester carboxylesterase